MDKTVDICQTCLSKDRALSPLVQLRDVIQEINICQLREPKGGICWECRSVLMKFTKFKLQVCIAQRLLRDTEQLQNLKSLSRLQTEHHTSQDYLPNCDPLTNPSEKSELVIIKEEYQAENDVFPLEFNSDCDKEIETVPQHVKDKNGLIDILNNDFYTVMFKDNIKNVKKKKITTKNITSNDRCNRITDNKITGGDLTPQLNSLEKTDVYTIKEECNDNKTHDIENIINYNNDRKKNITKKSKSRRRISDNSVGIRRKSITNGDESTNENVSDKVSIIVLTEEEVLRDREKKRLQPNFKKIPYKCDMCVLGFTKKENYDAHMLKKHDESIGEYSCHVCQTRYSRQVDLQRHSARHYARLRRDRRQCGQCGVEARTPEELAEHIKSKHSLVCNECGGKFKGKHTLRSHKIRIHSQKREFVCDVCTKTFTKKSRLESHMVTHDSALAKQLAYCATCNVQYKNIYIYRGHLRNSTNHSERAYTCAECNKKFSSRAYWTQHYKFYHLQKSQFVCEECDKIFISDWRLKNHRQKHHGLERPRDHQCNECGKKFFTLATLRGHQLTHSAQRSYLCTRCGQTFRQRPALYTHTRLVHRGETELSDVQAAQC